MLDNVAANIFIIWRHNGTTNRVYIYVIIQRPIRDDDDDVVWAAYDGDVVLIVQLLYGHMYTALNV